MKYQVCIPSYHGEGRFEEIEGYDEEDAACEALKERDRGDGPDFNESVFILVRESEDGEVMKLWASAEPDVHYGASEVEGDISCSFCKADLIEKLVSGKTLSDGFCNNKCKTSYYQNKIKELGI